MNYQEERFIHTEIDLLKEIIDNLPGGVVVFEILEDNIKVLFVNEETYQLFGYSKEEFKSRYRYNIFEIVKPSDLKELQMKLYDASKEKRLFETGCQCRHSDGTMRWTYFRVNFIETSSKKSIGVALITDSSKERSLQEQSRINEEMYHIAFKQSNVFLLEYDHQTKKVSCSNIKSLDYFNSPAFKDIPESLIESGYISECSINDLYSFYHQIVGGIKDGEVKLKVRSIDGSKDVWVKVKFTNIYDDNNQPIKAVGLYQNIDEQVNLESRYLREVKYRQKLMKRSIINLEVNLSTDEIIKTHSAAYSILGLDEDSMYNDFIMAMSKFVVDEDKDLFFSTFATENIVDAYHAGIDDLRISFLFYRESKKRHVWVSAHMMVAYNDESHQLLGFFYINDIDDDKRKTIELKRQASTDVLTGLINRRELERVISEWIGLIDDGNYGALFMIDVDDFKAINDNNGHGAGDDTLRFIAKRLKSLFRSDDVVGRFGGDEFMVYMKNIGDRQVVENKVSEVSKALSVKLDDKINVSCSIGVTFIVDSNISFDVAYHQADSAAYEAKKNGKRRYHVYK